MHLYPFLLPLAISINLGIAAAQTIFPGTKGWSYVGCYTETTTVNSTNNVRALMGGTKTTEDMTVGACLDYCEGGKYVWGGLEYTKECYCASSLNSLANKVADSECNLACVGNETQFCGGPLRLSVYQKDKEGGASGRFEGLGIAGVVLVGLGVGLGL